MLVQFKNPRLYFMLLTDSVIFIVAYVSAYLLRFEFTLDPYYIGQIKRVLPYLIPTKLAVFFVFGLYRGMWRYSSIKDFWRLGQASFLSMLLTIAIVLYVYTLTGFPRSVFLIDGILTFVMTGGLRMGIRSYYAAKMTSRGVRGFSLPRLVRPRKDTKRILILGAGNHAEKMLREISGNPQLGYEIVGFLDDDSSKHGRAVHEVPVLGSVEMLPKIKEIHEILEVFICMPSATGAQMRRIVEICKRSQVPHKTLPTIGEIIDGEVSIKALRDVNYEDLLRRPPVHLDTTGILDYLSGRTVLVTGAGGSIGAELCRQLNRFDPERLILIDASEANLFNIQMEFRDNPKGPDHHCILSSIQDRVLMERIYSRYRPQIVFHAAAYKHVPMLESYPWEAILNNVLGSNVTMELALKYGVERFVLVSTDKAVRPTNVMGTTKRLAELILQSLQQNGTRFMAVRFGNVLGSSGSVAPLFQKQIRQGGPVTVTHPDMTRYFMTISEAAQLILQAGAMGEGGEIFVLEMGTPVKIADMARDLIILSGKEPGKDIEITFTGIRPGEKLYEELITASEEVATTRHEKIMVLRSNGHCGHGTPQQDSLQNLDQDLNELYRIAKTHDACAIKQKLKQLVPEYTPQETEFVL